MGDAEIFGAGIGSIRGVVNNTDIKRGRIKVDNGALGRFLIISGFGNGGKIRTGFHFDDTKIVLGIFF